MDFRKLDSDFFYNGNDLGATYSKTNTIFKIWAPTATKVELQLFLGGSGDNKTRTVEMGKSHSGVWTAKIDGDMHGMYYTYLVTTGNVTNEVVDIYAKAVGVNGNRGMVVDMELTDPYGFKDDKRPHFSGKDTDAIIYEVHFRDMSVDVASGIREKGKFLGMVEKGTVNSNGEKTGLDHVLDLGVTHVQIQPSYDYATVDETKLNEKQYNWGYDPKNYNVPEGSYSTDPYNGVTRIKEMKQMIMKLHEAGLRVNMDVVYNHTYNIEDSWFHKTVPGYYHRKNADGTFSNGSGCSNETASDHLMMRKYIVDSVIYWAKEYHIDGFRFDLMGIHDIETMNEVRRELDNIDPTIMVYGEGWAGGSVALDEEKLAMKKNVYRIDRVGAFNDDIRDGIKGNVFLNKDKGFVNGKPGMEDAIRFSVVGAIEHPEVSKTFISWAKEPTQSINYVSCHDNYTLWDKLSISNEEDTKEDRIKMNKLAAAIIMTAQGVPFFLAGEELLRTKPGKGEEKYIENSFCSPDEVNSIKWDDKSNVMDVYNYYKGLIQFRKANDSLRLSTAKDVQDRLKFFDNTQKNVVAYKVDDIIVIYNANKEDIEYTLPEGEWKVYVNGESAGVIELNVVKSITKVAGISALVLKKM